MEFKDMHAFYAVVEEGNISHAAKRLDVAQPALSKQMKKLEESLGVQLFERGSRRIRLTEAGQVLYTRVEQILGMVDGTVNEITAIGSGVMGSLKIGTVTTSGATLLPGLIKEFHKRYPKVTFQLWEGEGKHILELLDNRIIEIGITRTHVDRTIYQSITLSNEPLVMVMQKNLCCCGESADSVSLLELKDQPLIIPLRWKTIFLAQCSKLGFVPKIVCVSDGVLQNILWTKMGIGMALVPESTKELLSEEELVYKTIVDPAISTQTVIAWLRNRTLSHSGQHFLALFKEMFK
ncbi:MAG: putative LysR family transcriptional regulator [Massilibacillus sp.]|jgi:DNA-binding transcriptional LysR family regulator|nr:putative LysR family transcriptional regulator [Massilibacillus sp.]